MRGEKRPIYKDLIGLPDVNTGQIFHLKLDRRRVFPSHHHQLEGALCPGRPVWILGTIWKVFGRYSTRNFRNESLKDLKVIRLSTRIFTAPRDLDLALLMFCSRRLESLKH